MHRIRRTRTAAIDPHHRSEFWLSAAFLTMAFMFVALGILAT